MKTELEHRRFRTWESETDFDPSRSWKIVLKFGWIRLRSTWYTIALLIFAVLYNLVMIGMTIIEHDQQSLTGEGVLVPVMGSLNFAVLFMLVAGSPMFAEDTRFNAQLFYYSKPMSAWDYFRAKMSMLVGLSAFIALVPIVILMVLLLVVSGPSMPDDLGQFCEYNRTPAEEAACVAKEQHAWRVTHVDNLGDVFYMMVVLVPGFTLSLTFLASIFAVTSAYVERAWHAAMGALVFFGGLSALGAVGSEAAEGSSQYLFGPLQWMYAITGLPMDLRFDTGANPYVANTYAARAYAHSGLTIALAYLFILGVTLLAARLTLRRLEQLEEAA